MISGLLGCTLANDGPEWKESGELGAGEKLEMELDHQNLYPNFPS
jgi:hypothetical protein